MRLKYKQTEKMPENSFHVRQERIPCIEQDWHFHTELELIYFIKSAGTLYVGNSIGNFVPGELYMIGSNVPHLFRNYKEYYENYIEGEAVNLVVIKFEPDFLGSRFMELIETKKLESLFQKANRGLKFSKAATYLVHNHILGLVNNQGLSKIIIFLTILNILLVSENYTLLCSEAIVNQYNKSERDRMAKVISFITENFDKKIELEEVASIAYMTPNSFCRYFKKHTHKSFTQYLNEIRLRNACKLLIEGESQISSIGYQCGFNTLTNFNKQFKSLMKETPTQYLERCKSYI
jgi:AraC-like DNA-binding protein/mannose-6-phosphate isomerase-like protein (cupin superfamily)